jgi:hypothetical protein
MPTNFKNGQYRFKKTGTVYFARLGRDGVWVWKGERITAHNYCGVFPIERFLSEYEKV